MVYKEYFDSPLTFLHFLEQRTLATKEPKLTLNDELDHLGMYIKHNYYTLELEDAKDYSRINFYGYRADLDNYFSKLYHPQLNPVKPTQILPDIFCFFFQNFINYISLIWSNYNIALFSYNF